MVPSRSICATVVLLLASACSRVANDADGRPQPDVAFLAPLCGTDAGKSALCIEDHSFADACAASFPDKPRRWACDRIPENCAYLFAPCTNCIEFCCGDQPSAAARYAVDAGPVHNPPPRCTRRAMDDWTCDRQQKPLHAFRCATNLPADDSGLPRYPEGCLGNPYGDDGRVCTFEKDGECQYCGGYFRDICCE